MSTTELPHVPARAFLNDGDACRRMLHTAGAAYLDGLGTGDALLRIAAHLGRILDPAVYFPGAPRDNGLYAIGVDGERPHRNRYGQTVHATTGIEFGLHTDCFECTRPPRHVLMVRTDSSDEQPDVTVSDFALARRGLGAQTAAILHEPLFPSAHGPVPAVTGDWIRMNPNWRGCYGADDAAPGEQPEPIRMMSARAVGALREMTAALEAAKATFKLLCGDGWIVDNWRMAHGRGALRPDSVRVLKRAWVA